MPMFWAAAKAISRYPACAIEEYASMRFTFDCTSAAMLPMNIESTAETHTIQNHPGAPAMKKMRRSTANTAAFGAVDISATTGAGAPSYTSGVQTWNGAEATLKPSPTNISATAVSTSGEPLSPRSVSAIWSTLVEPVAPNINATPYKKKAVANEP